MSGHVVNARILHTLLEKKCRLFSDVKTRFNFLTHNLNKFQTKNSDTFTKHSYMSK